MHKIFGSKTIWNREKYIGKNIFDIFQFSISVSLRRSSVMVEETYWTKLREERYWTTLSYEQKAVMIGLPFPFIIGGLGYLICVHLYNDETQSCPIMDIFCPKKSTKAVTVSMPEVDLEDDWWKGLVVAAIVILLILLGSFIKWIVGYIKKRRLNRTILDINEEEKWEYASSPKADKIEEAESTSS